MQSHTYFLKPRPSGSSGLGRIFVLNKNQASSASELKDEFAEGLDSHPPCSAEG